MPTGPTNINSGRSGRLLMEVALQFGATLDIDMLLPLVLARITELFNAERALFALFDDNRQVTHAVVHNLAWPGGDAPLPVSQSLINEVMDKDEAVVVADAARDVDMSARQSVRLHGLRFMMGVPVRGRGRVVGVLYTDSRAEAVRDLTGELELINALARLVGTAVENARLFEEQRFRHGLLAKMVHDFRAPLTVMRAYGQYLQAAADDPGDVQAAADDIIVVTARMERQMENAIELSTIDQGLREVSPEGLDLATSLPNHVRLLAAYARARDLTLVTDIPPELPCVSTLPEQVWICLDNLVFNAIKHAKAGTAIHVTGCLRDDAGPASALGRRGNSAASLFERETRLEAKPTSLFVQLAVHNEGAPIPEELLPRLFRQFVRGSATTGGVRNSGLGLSIVDQCARHLGGAVWVESTATEGTTFFITLPTDVDLTAPARPRTPLPSPPTTPPPSR